MVIKLLSPKDVNYLTDCKGTDYVEFLGCDHHENIYDYYFIGFNEFLLNN